MLKYFIIIVISWVSLAPTMNPANPKTDKAEAQCMQDFDSRNDRMTCTRIVLTLNFSEKAAEPHESDSECIKKCKKELAAAIESVKSSIPNEEFLLPAHRLLVSEKRATLLAKQFLQCLETCKP